eukprot:GHVS01032190.1.p1 GENE.GHVS01032190.1~~GHVS01032190.1.p1  ORF type:complete len:642 (-),score=143.10 GHVS01032190.1:427-2352(-)
MAPLPSPSSVCRTAAVAAAAAACLLAPTTTSTSSFNVNNNSSASNNTSAFPSTDEDTASGSCTTAGSSCTTASGSCTTAGSSCTTAGSSCTTQWIPSALVYHNQQQRLCVTHGIASRSSPPLFRLQSDISAVAFCDSASYPSSRVASPPTTEKPSDCPPPSTSSYTTPSSSPPPIQHAGSAAVAEALGSSTSSCSRLNRSIDFSWYLQFPRQMSLAQFEANGPIEDRASLCLIETSEQQQQPGEGRCQVVMAAVYDGHGGYEVADYVQRLLPLYLQRSLTTIPSSPSAAASSASYLTSVFPFYPNSSSSSLVSMVPSTPDNSRHTAQPSKPVTPAAPSDAAGVVIGARTITNDKRRGGQEVVYGSSLCCMEPGEIHEAMREAFRDLDEEIFRNLEGVYRMGYSKSVKTGACCVCVLADDTRIVVANVGDCKAVLCRKGKALPLNEQQNADCPKERLRLRRDHPDEDDAVLCKRNWTEPRVAGHYWEYPLQWMGVGLGEEHMSRSCYVKGRLQPTRSFGDFYLKKKEFSFDTARNRGFVREPHSFPYITADPTVDVFEREAADEFIVLCSDGVWDFLTDEEVVEIVREKLPQSAEIAVQAVIDNVLLRAAAQCGLTPREMHQRDPKERRRYYDDTTVVVLKL